MDLLTVTPDMWMPDELSHLAQLSYTTKWESIPLLNVNDLQHLSDKKLVRFRGMVQDTFSPSYYYEKFEVINQSTQNRSIRNGKYADIVRCGSNEVINYDSKDNVTSECQTLVMIAVPGLNDWAQKTEEEKYKLPPNIPTLSPNNSNKRGLEEETMSAPENDPPCSSSNQNKRLCTAQTSQSTTSSMSTTLLQKHLRNFPLPERVGKMCHVILYKDYDKVSLNNVLEVVGFLSLEEVTADDESAMETDDHNPPPSLVPRIHCVKWRKLFHSNPLIENTNIVLPNITPDRFNPLDGAVLMEESKMQHLKRELHMVLTQLFMGDALASEYFIYYLISKIYLRQEPFLTIGKFTLNISHIPVTSVPDYGKHLYQFIELLVTKSHYLPMTLQNMNKITFIPKKDYDCDKMFSGLLQLSNHTCLVLDETKLSAGQLNESGVRAASALSTAIKNQKVSYDFVFYPIEYDCDIPMLILSEGKSFLPSDYHIPLRTDQVCVDTFEEITEAAKHFLNPDLLTDMRMYLTLARHGRCEISDRLSEPIQNEFMRLRQTESITPDDLHSLLVLTRLICLSEGKRDMDMESWGKACRLEKERRDRVK